MKLHDAPGACSLAAHIALREIGVHFEGIAVNLATHATTDGTGSRTISPRSCMPLLQLDGEWRLTEAASLPKYVADDYSVADACALSILNSAHALALPVTPHPHPKPCLTRVSERPRLREAWLAEGLAQ